MSEEEKLLKEAKKLPWEDRLLHKNWKVRNEANIDLASVCDSITDPKDPRLREFGPLFRKTVADSNAPVQDKALDALIAFLRATDADAGRYAKETCDAITAKCLTGRPKTIEKSQTVFMLWVELEAVDVFLDTMEKAIKNKVAKAVVPAIDVMFQALSEFGTKVIPAKRILKMLPDLFDHQDQNVRASSKGLTIELCRWIGKETVKSILFEKMRDTMKKELEAELVNVSGMARPSRKIRSEQDKDVVADVVAEVADSRASEELTNDAPQEVDEYELLDPVDILTPLDKSGFWNGVKATKWSERKEAVAELTKLASIKRISPGDFTEVCRTLKKLITDVNLAVSIEAVQAAGNLGRGLRTHFAGNSRFLLPVLLEKLKEKKPTLTEALTQTLQAMHKAGCLNLGDIVEDVKVATKNKVPLVRSLTLTWVACCIEASSKVVILKMHKDYVPICMESLNDGTPEVRDAAFSALAAIAKLVGMRPLERSLEKLDDVRKKKLSELIGSSESSNQGCTSSVQTSTRAISTLETSESSFVRRSAASMLTGKKPTQVLPANKKGGSAKPASGKKGDAHVQLKGSKHDEPEDVEPTEMALEEIERRLDSVVQAETVSQLKSGVWKERLEAIVSLKEQVERIENIDKSVEILIRLLCTLPGWSEKNVQVQQQVIEVICHISSRVNKFPKKCVVLCIQGISERVADIKTRVLAMKCLTIFSEAVGPGFIFERLYKIMKEHKNPKVLSEGILWMVSAVEDFGVSHVKLKDLIDFCKDTGLQSSVPATRNSTIKLIGVLHKFVGPDIKGFLTDVKPALLSALEAEYEKNPWEGPSAVTKRIVKTQESFPSAGGLDSLPRQDISGKITTTLLKGLESPDWKVRMESIEDVNKILEESNRRIQPIGTVELFGGLRGRLYDSNKNLVMATLSTLGAVASAMGPTVEKASKGILSDVLKCLSDNKKHMRECTLSALDLWAGAVHLEKMAPYIANSLVDSKLGAEGRKDLFDWLTKQICGLSDFPDAVHFLKPAASALMDKSVDVRKAADTCIAEIVRVGGQENLSKNLKDLQGSALALVLERLKPYGSIHESFDCTKPVSLGPASRNTAKVVKSVSNGLVDRQLKHGGRAMPPRGVSGKGSRPEKIFSALDIGVQSQALLNVKESNKETRERFVIRRFKFEELRPEQIQDLEGDIMKYFREDLHRNLLSTDFKKQVDGLEMLQKALPTIRKEIIEVIDVLLRWCVLRFCESNTTCLLKVLEFLPELLVALKDASYTLTEAEASLFLPCLVEKSGHNIEKVREKMRELMKQIIDAYTATKFIPYILEGLRSKNNRTRIECAELVGFLIENHLSEISGQLKSLQVVASLTAERDGETRKAALNALATGYKVLGDDIWKYIGKVSDAQQSMLDDRFKWKAREMDKRKEGKPGDARALLRRAVRDNGSEIAEQSGEISRSAAGPNFISRRENYSLPEANTERNMLSRELSGVNSPTDWNGALDIILCSSPEQSVEGMKVVCHELAQVMREPEGSLMVDIEKDTDRLVSCLANKVPKSFEFSLAGASSRSCKYVLNTLMQTFQNKRLAHAVKETTLDGLITELLLWLLDERVTQMDDGSQLLRALNVLMLKILDNANRTSSFVVLIKLLRPLDPSRWSTPTTEENSATRTHKFLELVVKCLIKLTKVLPTTIHDVELDRILQCIHVYMQELGMEEIKRRAGADDKPLRMVKTVLHELVKLKGTAIKGHLSMVPIDTEPQPIILSYIELNLQTLAAARMLAPTGLVGQTHWGDCAANNPSPATQSTDAQLKQELAAVFKKIGDKQTCSIGLYELYRITQLYPNVDIFAQLQNASEAFRTYIRDGLSQMEKNAAAGRSPSSLPLSTPPPLVLNASSPKYASVATVQSANSLYDMRFLSARPETMSFSMPSTEFRHNLAEQRTERPLAASSGNLDAIRERMKSIQLAAATVNNPDATRPLMSANGSLSLGFSSEISNTNDHLNREISQQDGGVLIDDRALSGLQARMERLKSGTMDSL